MKLASLLFTSVLAAQQPETLESYSATLTPKREELSLRFGNDDSVTVSGQRLVSHKSFEKGKYYVSKKDGESYSCHWGSETAAPGKETPFCPYDILSSAKALLQQYSLSWPTLRPYALSRAPVSEPVDAIEIHITRGIQKGNALSEVLPGASYLYSFAAAKEEGYRSAREFTAVDVRDGKPKLDFFRLNERRENPPPCDYCDGIVLPQPTCTEDCPPDFVKKMETDIDLIRARLPAAVLALDKTEKK
jgi:hypothetical protein